MAQNSQRCARRQKHQKNGLEQQRGFNNQG
jgi:hypothetical protein